MTTLKDAKNFLGKEPMKVARDILQYANQDCTEKDVKIINVSNLDYFNELTLYLDNVESHIKFLHDTGAMVSVALMDNDKVSFLEKEFFLDVRIDSKKYKNYINNNSVKDFGIIPKKLLDVENLAIFNIKIDLASLKTRKEVWKEIEESHQEQKCSLNRSGVKSK